jgi:hypothetical protein
MAKFFWNRRTGEEQTTLPDGPDNISQDSDTQERYLALVRGGMSDLTAVTTLLRLEAEVDTHFRPTKA